MPSTFAEHYTRALASVRVSNDSFIVASENSITPTKQSLRALLISLNPPLSVAVIRDALQSIALLNRNKTFSSAFIDAKSDEEQNVLERTVVCRLMVGLYAETLDLFLSEASELECEAEWWADIERSRQKIAWYLIQSLPSRLLKLTRTILHTIRSHNLPIRPSIFTPSSFRRLFPSPDVFRPNALAISLFPHLRHQSYTVALSLSPFLPIHSGSETASSVLAVVTSRISHCTHVFLACLAAPLELVRQECEFKRVRLEKMRDERAASLGRLAELREELANVLEDSFRAWSPNRMSNFVLDLDKIINGQENERSLGSPEEYVFAVDQLANTILPSQALSHEAQLRDQNLLRPSRLTLLWPRLLLLPPVILYSIRSLYVSRASLFEVAKDAKETVEGFLRGWLMEPMMDVVKTVRAGGEEGVIVRKEGVAADYASLERMALSLAKDELYYGSEQLESLSRQIRLGDLTPVLQLYEEDIKSPLKSAVTGTLLRSVFIQVQKAKVDIDQALTGIDKLLKSQELTFAFVGVAPAFTIVYLIGGYLRSILFSGGSGGRYGGKHGRASAWFALRRIERLLVSQPDLARSTNSLSNVITPLTSGLLLLSVARLRTYAEQCLPLRSRLREGFLEDVEDLEDTRLGRVEKLRVVERMWRCWGKALEWSRVASER